MAALPHSFADRLDLLQERLDYRFTNQDLLIEALSHPSISKEMSRRSYERLEFVGDAVLGMVMAELLFNRFPEAKEGELAKREAALVCGEMITELSKELGLGEFLFMSMGEENSGGRVNDANLENVLEALIGAIYFDAGLDAVRPRIEKWWANPIECMVLPPKDPKTSLQEWVQSQGKPLPSYRIVNREGPSHAPIFTIQLDVEGQEPVLSRGPSRRVAERNAAAQMMEQLTNQQG